MDIRRLIDDAIGEPPPSTVDLDTVMARGRRAATLRRVGPVVGAAAAAALVVFAAIVLPARGGPDNGVAAGPPSQETTVPGCRVLEPPTPAQASRTRHRLTIAVRELVGERLPLGERMTRLPAAHDSQGNYYGPLEFFQRNPPGTAGAATKSTSCEEDPYAYLAYAKLDLHHPAGSLTAAVFRSTRPIQPCPPLSDKLRSCKESSGPNGAQIRARTVIEDPRSVARNIVEMNRNGTTVLISSANAVETGTPDNPGALPISPLDQNHLVEIALDSRLELP